MSRQTTRPGRLALRLLLGALVLGLTQGCAQSKKGTTSTWQPDRVQDERNPASTPPPPVTDWLYAEAPAVPDGFQAHERLQRVAFASSSASLSSEARGALSGTVELIQGNFQWHLLLVGFTDNGGESGRAGALGRERSESVRRYLEGRGIDGSRITTMSLGSAYAQGDQYEPETRARDRAVEVWAFLPR